MINFNLPYPRLYALWYCHPYFFEQLYGKLFRYFVVSLATLCNEEHSCMPVIHSCELEVAKNDKNIMLTLVLV